MDVSLGKSLDAWVGRLIDFVAADPLRREVRLKLEAEPVRTEVREKAAPKPERKTAAPKPKRKAAPKKKAVAKPKKKAAKKPARPRPAAVKALDEAVRRAEAAFPGRAALAAVDRQVLDALAAFADGAGITELVSATGRAAGDLRRRLEKLAAAGRVERVGAKLRTRFRLTGE